MRGFRMVNAPDGTFVGNVFQNRNGSATAYSIHPGPGGEQRRHIATSMDAGAVWLLAIDESVRRQAPVPLAIAAT
jgi:hypothetical protein